MLLVLLLLIVVAAAKIVLPARPLWIYVFPLPAIAMLVAGLLEARLAIVLASVAAILVSTIVGGSSKAANWYGRGCSAEVSRCPPRFSRSS